MSRNGSIRLIVMLLFGALFGFYTRHDYAKWNQRGREAFLAMEGHRFDLNMADPKPLSANIFGGAIVALMLFGAYEGVVFSMSSIVGRAAPTDKHSPHIESGAGPGALS